jgi:phosphomevalonate kinase
LSPIVARAPGKLVALGEYAVLDGAPALVVAVDRYVEAAISASDDTACRLETRVPEPKEYSFRPGEPSGAALVDLLIRPGLALLPAWQGRLDSSALFADGRKLGLGSSAAALCAWAGAWAAYCRRFGAEGPRLELEALIAVHRTFQGGGGSGLDVAASLSGGAIEYRIEAAGRAKVGSVRLPNSVGFAGIFAGKSASTPALIAHYRAWRAEHPQRAAAVLGALSSVAEAGCAAAREGDAGAFVEAIGEYGRGLQNLGIAIGADIVTAEHRQIGEDARRHGVAYKVSGAGGGDLGFACAADREALDRFKRAVSGRGFRVVGLNLAERGLDVDGRVGERVSE